MRDRSSLFLLSILVVGAMGCAGGAVPIVTTPPGSATLSGLTPEDFPSQRVLRVRYQGQGEEGNFRTILRLVDAERFQLSAVDPLGRALWGLAYDDDEVHFVNYRRRLECRTSGSAVISSLVLDSIPVRDLPAILVGRLPGTVGAAHETRQGRLRDSSGREWSVSDEEGKVQGWTLWGEEGPLLWFHRMENGGVLSHRTGGQFRWRETLRESLEEIPAPLSRPEETRMVPCDQVAGQE